MALKLTKFQHEALVLRDQEAHTLWAAVAAALEKFNGARQALFETLDGIESDLRGEFDDKSEKWQEGERGVAASEWLDALRTHADNIEAAVDLDPPEWIGEMANIETEPNE